MNDQLQQKHPDFHGNWDDLEHFMHLAQSPIRGAERSKVLQEWSKYKLHRQLAWPGARDQEGMVTKGGYINALTVRVIALRGADLSGSLVHGVSPWNIRLDNIPALQRDLTITSPDETPVQVDSLEIAQLGNRLFVCSPT